jgi:glycyl-radical enzyme activating protein
VVKGRIFDIQRFSIHDGPGIRTTVFFKGCPLNCLWCGNPESIDDGPSLSYLAERCVGCGACVEACPHQAVTLDDDQKAVLDREHCTECGECVEGCPPRALEIVGRDATVDEVLQVVLRDRDYYTGSGGGMTLSGGEPVYQPEFAAALLKAARTQKLHCCVETSGYAPWTVFETLRPFVDLWLYDFKETDPRLHVKFTRVGNGPVLANLKRLHTTGAKIILRCPMIPEHNARKAHLDGIVSLAAELPQLQGVELMPYYNLWRGKLERFGLASRLPESVQPPDSATVRSWKEYLSRRGVPISV